MLPARRMLAILAACCLANVANAQTGASSSYGTYSADLPDGTATSKWTMRCQGATCSLTIDKEVARHFYKPTHARTEHLAQARADLNYDRERKAALVKE